MEAGAWLLMLQLALLTSGLPAASCAGSWESSAPGALGGPGPWPGPSNPSTVSHSCSQGQKGQEPQGDSMKLEEEPSQTSKNALGNSIHHHRTFIRKTTGPSIPSTIVSYEELSNKCEYLTTSKKTQKNYSRLSERFGTIFKVRYLFPS